MSDDLRTQLRDIIAYNGVYRYPETLILELAIFVIEREKKTLQEAYDSFIKTLKVKKGKD